MQLREVDDVSHDVTSDGWMVRDPSIADSCMSHAPAAGLPEPNLLPEPMLAIEDQLAPPQPRVIGRRGEWKLVHSEIVGHQAGTKAEATKWLSSHKHMAKPLMPSSKAAQGAWIAKCDRCKQCSHQWCFSKRTGESSEETWLDVEEQGVCSGPLNLKRVRLERARACALAGLTYGQTAKRMHAEGVPREQWPTEQQMENQKKIEGSPPLLGCLPRCD